MNRIRIVLADDHVLLLDTVRNLLEPHFDVVGTFSDGEALVAAAASLQPDVVILDLHMPKMNGFLACVKVKELLPKAKVVFLTMNQDLETAGQAFRSGASGYVLKTSAASELLAAIREVANGGYFAPASLTDGMLGSFVKNFKRMKSTPELTTRQKEVLQLLVEGMSMKQVANVLKITPRTVAFHKYSMMEQLKIRSSAELIAYAMSSGSWNGVSANPM